MEEIGLQPDLYSIWKGATKWEGKTIFRFSLYRLWALFFWIPYWAWKKPRAFKDILIALWNRPCPNLQNWNETFLALGFALVEAQRIKEKDYTLFHGVWATMPTTAAFALSKLTDVPFSMGAHAYDVFRKGGDWILGLKFESASFIRTSSLSTAKRIEELGARQDKIKLIRRGLAYWPNRGGFGLVNNECLEILSVGRLVEKKGYFNQLIIARQLNEVGIPFRLRIVGAGPLMNELIMERDRLGLVQRVEFLGSQNQESIREYYITSDIFLFTGVVARNGDRDGIPNVIPEAMAAGCLILSSCFAGASEAFIDRISGFSINPFNTKEWVDLVAEFWQSPESFSSIRKSAIKHSKDAFNIERTANSLSDAMLNCHLI